MVNVLHSCFNNNNSSNSNNNNSNAWNKWVILDIQLPIGLWPKECPWVSLMLFQVNHDLLSCNNSNNNLIMANMDHSHALKSNFSGTIPIPDFLQTFVCWAASF